MNSNNLLIIETANANKQAEGPKVQINDAFDGSHVATFWGKTLADAHLTATEWVKKTGLIVLGDAQSTATVRVIEVTPN